MHKVDSEEVAGLMLNPEKTRVRSELSNQIIEAAVKAKRKTLRTATLPGTNFVFEAMTTASAAYNDIALVCDCFELNSARHAYARQFKPENVLYRLDTLDSAGGDYDAIWADYCTTLSQVQVDTAVKIAGRSSKACLVYVSFCMGRKDYKAIARKLKIKVTTPRAIVETAMARALTALKKPHSLVYSVYYAGGIYGKTAMMTVGFQMAKKPTVRVIVEDRTEAKSADRQMEAAPTIEREAITTAIRMALTEALKREPKGLSKPNWRTRFIQDCTTRFGCTYQHPTGVVNWAAKQYKKGRKV